MKIEIIKKCPCCDSLLDRVKDQLFCRNTNCEAQNSKRVQNFTKKAKIKGFGEKTLEKLEVNSIPELYDCGIGYLEEVMGDKMGLKLFEELEKSLNMTLATFIAAQSIPLIGTTAGNKLVTVISSIEEINQETCKEAGLGEKAATSLVNWIKNEYPSYSEIPFALTVETKPTNVTSDPSNGKNNDITVCCTGKIEGHTRNSLQELLNNLGVKVGNSVTAKTSFLICEEFKGSSKEKKAESLEIEILPLTEFLNKIGNK